MTRPVLVLLVALLSLPASADQGDPSRTYRDLLRTLHYAELFRISIGKTCVTQPKLQQNEPFTSLCRKVSTIRDETIEKAAEPHIRRHVPRVEAIKALQFWSSPAAMRIQDKILEEMRNDSRLLTEAELRTLDQANKSSFGAALSRLAQDTTASIAIIREVAANVP